MTHNLEETVKRRSRNNPMLKQTLLNRMKSAEENGKKRRIAAEKWKRSRANARTETSM